MDASRWERIQALFHEAAGMDGEARREWLATACCGDEALMGEVLSLLAEDESGRSVLDDGLAGAARDVLDGGAPVLPPGDFGPYRFREVLGEGGMGIVYLAERTDVGGLVAIKVLRDAWLSPARRERFAAEQRTLAQLNHPFIARLYDADTLPDGTPWFVMEYVDGLPLTEYCATRGTSIPGRLQLFRSVCEAVQFAHGHAVIHRDLKPSNIFVKRDGSVRLLDFGIAKQLESLDAPADQTRTALRLMTPAYAAPEQLRGERVGIHTDVYSLGVILYELLTGRLPFDPAERARDASAVTGPAREAEKPSAAYRKLATRSAPELRPSPRGKTSWADLDVLCLTAMHADPHRRYRSVEALIRDIDHYLAGQPLEARPDTVGYRLRKFVGRHRRQVFLAALASVALVTLIVFFTARVAVARRETLAEAARKQRIQQFMLSLFEGGETEAGPPEDLRVVTLLERGVQQARSLEADPETQADLYQTLGGIYGKLGDPDRADSLLRSALDLRRDVLGPDNREVAESILALGLLRMDQARVEDAERLVREALDMYTRSLPPGDALIARATAALGRVLQERGDYDESIRLLEEAAQFQSAPGMPEADLAETLSQLANTHFYAGRYDESRSINERVLEMDRRIHGDRHPHVADDLINLGAIAFNGGLYGEAERLDREALDILRDWYGPEHPETASCMTVLGRALVYQEKYDEAVGLLDEALRIQERVYGPTHPRVASVLNDLGIIALKRGDTEDAKNRFRRMAGIYRELYGDRHYLVAVALSNLASVFLDTRDYASAEPMFRDVVARYTAAISADDMNTGIARVKLGRALLGLKRYGEAETETRAGYGILTRQVAPSTSWLQSARTDLVTIYEALNRPAEAAKFRAELEAARAPEPGTGAG